MMATSEPREICKNSSRVLHENPAHIDVLTELDTAQFVNTNTAEIAGNERMLRRMFGYPKPAPTPAAKPAAPATAAPAKK